METLKLPVDIILNKNLTHNDILMYTLITSGFKKNERKEAVINLKLLKAKMKISDSRTIKKSIENLKRNGLLNYKRLFINANSTFATEIIYKFDHNYVEVSYSVINKIITNSDANAFRVYCYYLYHLKYISIYGFTKPTTTDMCKALKMGRTTVTNMVRVLNELELFTGIINDDGLNSDLSELIVSENVYIPNQTIEGAIENQLINKMHLIEDGMVYLDNQYKITDGIIDILARDKKGTLCIIEVKAVSNCKDLIFQATYYPTQFEEKVRLITICPNYDVKIKLALSRIGYVEMKRYILEDGDIISVADVER